MPYSNTSDLSTSAFAALGTIVGYLGTEVASDSMFHRMLWPSRFYNTHSLVCYMAFALFMSIGGPVHKAAVVALDQLSATGLWKGRLGTVFFSDTQKKYTLWKAHGNHGSDNEVRNGFWVDVLGLVDWKQHKRVASTATSQERAEYTRTQRPVFTLKLSRKSKPLPAQTHLINGDVGPFKWRYAAGVVLSELSTLSFGIATAVIWKTAFAIWYLGPLLLKCIALLSRTRREALEQLDPTSSGDMICEIEDFTNRHMVICGPGELISQYFKHYGHPVRRGYQQDRIREVISILVIVATALLYPGGLIAFIFAPVGVQWVWLSYQLYAMLAMHVYRFSGGENLGSTQYAIARELSSHRTAFFDDGSGTIVSAELETYIANRVAEGKEEVARVVQNLLGCNADQEGRPVRTLSQGEGS